jgi:hypothetical protein
MKTLTKPEGVRFKSSDDVDCLWDEGRELLDGEWVDEDIDTTLSSDDGGESDCETEDAATPPVPRLATTMRDPPTRYFDDNSDVEEGNPQSSLPATTPEFPNLLAREIVKIPDVGSDVRFDEMVWAELERTATQLDMKLKGTSTKPAMQAVFGAIRSAKRALKRSEGLDNKIVQTMS